MGSGPCATRTCSCGQKRNVRFLRVQVNARMGGGPVRNTNLLVWGVDLVEQHVTASCGIPCRPAVAQKPLMELAELTLNAKVRTAV
jgi:hypothetical protein